jgi:hypothetical protein
VFNHQVILEEKLRAYVSAKDYVNQLGWRNCGCVIEADSAHLHGSGLNAAQTTVNINACTTLSINTQININNW